MRSLDTIIAAETARAVGLAEKALEDFQPGCTYTTYTDDRSRIMGLGEYDNNLARLAFARAYESTLDDGLKEAIAKAESDLAALRETKIEKVADEYEKRVSSGNQDPRSRVKEGDIITASLLNGILCRLERVEIVAAKVLA